MESRPSSPDIPEHMTWTTTPEEEKETISRGIREIRRSHKLRRSHISMARFRKRKDVEKKSELGKNPDHTKATGVVRLLHTSDFSERKRLGEGNFSRTQVAILNKTKIKVTIKIPKTRVLYSHQWGELEAMANLKPHKNVVDFIGVVKIQDSLCLVTKFCARGSLDKLHSVENLTDEKEFLRVGTDIVSGLVHLHSSAMIHRDLGCRNCFMEIDKTVVVGDYGQTRKLPEGMSSDCYATSGASEVHWSTAPEFFKTGRCSFKSDIYMLGITFLEIQTKGGMNAYRRAITVHPDSKRSRRHKYFLEIPQKCSPFVRSMISKCIDPCPDNRPNSSEVLAEFSREVSRLSVLAEKASSSQKDRGEVRAGNLKIECGDRK
ncbi:hypothetical protein AAMO2058_001731400, partial [Amorphochlora amoebiformis]